MQCLACGKILSDKEATRKFTSEQERPPEMQFVDLCNGCFDTIRYDVETDDVDIFSTDSYQEGNTNHNNQED